MLNRAFLRLKSVKNAMFEHYFYLKGDNFCWKITNFVSETLPDMTGVRTQVGSWPDVLPE